MAAGLRALENVDFRRFQLARVFSILASQIQTVAVGWQVYGLTGTAWSLGLTGLVQFLPLVAFAIPGGNLADRYDRRRVLSLCHLASALLSGGLAWVSVSEAPAPGLIYLLLGLGAVVRAVSAPTASALSANLVPKEDLANAVAWSSSIRQLSVLVGPALGGFLYALAESLSAPGASTAYGAAALSSLIALGAVAAIRSTTQVKEVRELSWKAVIAGFRFVRENRLLLGTISLDLFAVLLGGATALLPIYAKDILHVGPWGLGLLRSAPAIGAGLVAVTLAFRPMQRGAGTAMLWCVALFGVATIVFGVSESFPLSLLALAVLGGADMVSVVVRLTLEQLATPEEMRGRVSAVNIIFISASNELGDFESGIAAGFLGPVGAVVSGGIGTLLVVALWAKLFPEIRDVKNLQPRS
ncbi:MAG: MFS transporter [Myxococcaceae bacterium]|nr:MFS transporter [Myxococcaceae bacterium]